MMYGGVPKIDAVGVLPSADRTKVILVFAQVSKMHRGNHCFLVILYSLHDSQVRKCLGLLIGLGVHRIPN